MVCLAGSCIVSCSSLPDAEEAATCWGWRIRHLVRLHGAFALSTLGAFALQMVHLHGAFALSTFGAYTRCICTLHGMYARTRGLTASRDLWILGLGYTLFTSPSPEISKPRIISPVYLQQIQLVSDANTP